MKTFPVAELARLIREITETTAALDTRSRAGDSRDGKIAQATLRLFRRIRVIAERGRLANCLRVVREIEAHHRHQPKGIPTVDALAADARHIRDTLIAAVQSPRFVMLDSDRASLFEQYALFGFEVHNAFPSARYDIQEAGNCLATGRSTAAVFHLMRAVEWGMRALCVHMGFKRLRTVRNGKVRYKPLEYGVWEDILSELQGRVDKKINKMRRGKEKHQAQSFYYPALQEIRAIRDAWRNHVMHARAEYSESEADAILGHVRRLMETLASRVNEV